MDDSVLDPRRERGEEAQDGNDPCGRFLKVADVAVSVGLSRSMIYRLMHEKADPFPPPIKIGGASLWVEREVGAWKSRRVRAARSD